MKPVLLAAAALALAGCNGGTVDRHALTNDASTLDPVVTLAPPSQQHLAALVLDDAGD